MRRDVFQAIADPTRRAMSPGALAEQFDTSRQAVSRHLKILTECQLLQPVSSGREVYYHLNAPKMMEVDRWLQPFRALWEDRFTQLDQVLKNPKHKKP